MNSKTLAKKLQKMGYTLRKTSSFDAPWMVISQMLKYHWDFKNLESVQRFIVDEKAMFAYARKHSTFRV